MLPLICNFFFQGLQSPAPLVAGADDVVDMVCGSHLPFILTVHNTGTYWPFLITD